MADNGKANGNPVLMPTMGFELWGPALAGAAKWNGKMYEGFALMGSEWLDFVNRRLKEDLNLPQRMCACRSPEEARETYVTFWRQAVDDYQKELAVMARLGTGFVSNSLTAAQSHAEEAARELRHPFAAAA
jgi:phasin protein